MQNRLKSLLCLFVAVILTSCTECSFPGGDYPSGEGVTVLTAAVSQTKTTLGGNKVCWNDGDRINVNGYDSDALYFNGETPATASFTIGAALTGPLNAVYPSFIYKDAQTVTLPQEQMYQAGSFGPDASPMLAYQTEGTSLTFSHPCAVLQIPLERDEDTHHIRYVEFRGNAGEQVCGDFTVDFENCAFTPAGGGKTVRVYLNKKEDTDVYIAVPAREYPQGYTVKIVDKNGHCMELSTTRRVVEKGTVYEMKSKEFVPTHTYLQSDSQPLRILGVGNSWTRDGMRYLSALAKYSDRKIIVGHGYLGGSTLEDQYKGIDDLSYTYVHSDQNQVVHNTYQYWKYDGTTNPAKTPTDEEGYANGLGGIGVTLESVVKDEPWDIIVFQPHVLVRNHMPPYEGFDINDLVARVKQMMEPEVAAKVRCGLVVPWTFAEGSEDKRQSHLDVYNGGVWPADQNEWDAYFERVHGYLQEDILKLAAHMGDNCEFIINAGQAIYNSRKNPALAKYGYKLQRAVDDTHLSDGLPMMIASLCYAYGLIDLAPGESTFYPSDSKIMVDGSIVTAETSKEDALQAQLEAWRVYNDR